MSAAFKDVTPIARHERRWHTLVRSSAASGRLERERQRRYSKKPPQAIPYEECLRRLLNRQRTVMA